MTRTQPDALPEKKREGGSSSGPDRCSRGYLPVVVIVGSHSRASCKFSLSTGVQAGVQDASSSSRMPMDLEHGDLTPGWACRKEGKEEGS